MYGAETPKTLVHIHWSQALTKPHPKLSEDEKWKTRKDSNSFTNVNRPLGYSYIEIILDLDIVKTEKLKAICLHEESRNVWINIVESTVKYFSCLKIAFSE